MIRYGRVAGIEDGDLCKKFPGAVLLRLHVVYAGWPAGLRCENTNFSFSWVIYVGDIS